MYKEEVEKDKKILTDYTISVGCACRPAHYLREHGLRRCSNPLDWMMFYTLDDVISLFKNEFSNFFENKKEYPEKSAGRFRYIEDVQNGMISMHSFLNDVDVDESYQNFSKTMRNRFARMKKCMLESEHVLFVSNREEPIENFEKFLIEIHKLFPCKFTYINVRYSDEYKKEKFIVTPELDIIEYGFKDVHPDGWDFGNPEFWKGNADGWCKVMQDIELTERFANLNLAQVEDKVQK